MNEGQDAAQPENEFAPVQRFVRHSFVGVTMIDQHLVIEQLIAKVEDLEKWRSSFRTIPVNGRQLGVEGFEVHRGHEGSFGEEFCKEQLQTVKPNS